MKTLLTLAICLAAQQIAFCQQTDVKDTLPAAPKGKTWKLVWHDEFDGTKLDETKWEVMPDAPRKGGWWMRKAVSLDGKGHLVISTLKEGDRYIDGCVRTKGKFEHSFGYYVARVQLAEAAGALVGVLDHGRRRGQGRQRWPRRHGNRHLRKAVAR